MYELNVRPLLFIIFLLLVCLPAQAKKTTLTDKNPFGMGFVGGIEKAPSNEFIHSPQGTSNNFSKFFSFEPFFDFANFVVKFTAAFHYHPQATARGTDSIGTFNESSDAKSYSYGTKVMLVPLISQSGSERLYFALGFGFAGANLKNIRNYTAAGTTTQTNTEKIKGKSQEFSASAGAEFILVQNYSLQIESGFREMKFNDLQYAGTSDLTGATKAVGSTAVDANGINKKFRQVGYFASLGLNLNF